MNRSGAPIDRLAGLLVATLAVGAAGLMLAAYYAHPDDLWRGVYHDRNSHLATGMNFALAIKAADPVSFFSQLLAMRVWGPLHGLVLATVFLVGGVDHRLAIIPSLLGWIVTVCFTWLIARRLIEDRGLGMFAGALAVVWVIASPAFRLLASDVMLEGIGAGLSALALWAYLAARARPREAGRWRALAIILTALFFHKANYWGMVAAALALAAASEAPGFCQRALAGAASRLRVARVWRRATTDPWLIGFVGLAGLAAWLYARGPTQTTIFGRRLSLYPPENLTTLAYAALFARLWIFWRRHRGAIGEAIGVPGRNLLYWHLAPVAVSFLLPKRLSAFVGFVGPANQSAAGGAYDPLGGAQLYWRSFADGFSVAPWAAVVALALAVVGAVQIHRYAVGGRVVFVFALLSAVAVIAHPQHQARFLASWIFSVWICAGAGAAMVMGWLTPEQRPRLRLASATLVLALFAGASTLQRPSDRTYADAIRATSGPSDLGLVRPYLPALTGARIVGFASTFGPTDLFAWVTEERCQCRIGVEHPWIGPRASRAEIRQSMLDQISRSKADHWVLLNAPSSPYQLPELGFTYDRTVGLVDAMKDQSRLKAVGVFPMPAEGAVATVYEPAAAKAKPAGA